MLLNRIIKTIYVTAIIGICGFIVYCILTICFDKAVKGESELNTSRHKLSDLTFSTQQYKFKNVKTDTILQYTFILKNTGNDTLFIESINPNCLCTNYYLSKKVIMQQDTAKIILTIDTKNKIGFYEINTIVTANTPKKYYLLKIYGEIGN